MCYVSGALRAVEPCRRFRAIIVQAATFVLLLYSTITNIVFTMLWPGQVNRSSYLCLLNLTSEHICGVRFLLEAKATHVSYEVYIHMPGC